MDPDQALVRKSLQGDQYAISKLVHRYESAVFVTAFGVTGNHHVAEDATQEALILSIKKLDSLKQQDRFGPWLMSIARRIALRLSQRQRQSVSLEYEAAIVDDMAPDEQKSTPWRSEQNVELMNRVALLPEHERVVVALKHFQGHSVLEIAEITQRPLGTVTKQLSRAYSRLRKQFQESQQ